ncbi:terpenoid synthase [Bisporella sp. PMI_857]|nr:terpenoid synthase [Bisporella sp. PMI_857]
MSSSSRMEAFFSSLVAPITPKTSQNINKRGQSIYIPDTMAHWPWPRSINPNYEVCMAESNVWLKTFDVFTPKAQAAFSRCEFGLLASLGYPKLNKDGCRVACDLMNLFFVFDEKSDLSGEHETRYQADCIMDALRNPHKLRPEGEWIGGRVTQEFWQNAIKTASESCQRRFVASFQRYTDAVVQQSLDRTHSHIRDINSYFLLRRETIGTLPSFALIELHYNIPDHVMKHPTIEYLTELCTDMISIGNDLYSYNTEQARGDEGHNLVTVVMVELDIPLQEAYDWIGHLHDDLVRDFLAEYTNFPSFPDESETVNREIREYADGLGNWVRTNERWSFEGGRYFGTDGLSILKSRTVALLPKKNIAAGSIFKA